MSNFFSSEVQALLDLESCKCSSKNDSSRLAFLFSSLKFGKILSKISGFCRINMPKNIKLNSVVIDYYSGKLDRVFSHKPFVSQIKKNRISFQRKNLRSILDSENQFRQPNPTQKISS